MSWNTALTALGVNRHCTRIEIKPHTRAGVNEAVGQLLGRRWAAIPNRACTGGRTLRHFLITYDLRPWPSDVAMIRILGVDASTQAVLTQRGWSLADLPFRNLGPVAAPRLNEASLRRDCPTERGTIMEDSIRREYNTQMRSRFKTWTDLPLKPGSATGPDIDHELAEFLAELAHELGSSS